MIEIDNGLRPLTQLMEWFPDLHKAEFDRIVDPDDHSKLPERILVEGLAARCPIPHDEENIIGVLRFQENPSDGLWWSTGCDAGCTWGKIIDICQAFRRNPGDDDDEEDKPVVERNRFVLAHTQFSIDELTKDPPPLKYILKPYIEEETVSTLTAPGGSNKTTLLTLLASSRALGRRMFRNTIPKEGETAILTTEDRKIHYLHKLAALRTHMGAEFDAAAIKERVHLFDMSGILVRLIDAERGNQFKPSSAIEELADALHRLAPKVDHVVIETISRMTGGIESNEAMTVLIDACNKLVKLTGVAVTLVGHVGQNAARSGLVDAYSGRGGSAASDNARSAMGITPITEDNRETYANGLEMTDDDAKRTLVWVHSKANGPTAVPLLLRREMTRFGPVLVDADYDKIEGASNITGKTKKDRTMTYDELKQLIVVTVRKAKKPISGNEVIYSVGGKKTYALAAIQDLVKDGSLSRDRESRLIPGTSKEPASGTSSVGGGSLPPLSTTVEREGGKGTSNPPQTESGAEPGTKGTGEPPTDGDPF